MFLQVYRHKGSRVNFLHFEPGNTVPMEMRACPFMPDVDILISSNGCGQEEASDWVCPEPCHSSSYPQTPVYMVDVILLFILKTQYAYVIFLYFTRNQFSQNIHSFNIISLQPTPTSQFFKSQ